MKIIAFFCLLTLLYCENISKADSAKVKISVAANNISNNEKIYITGNQKKLGNWKPDVVEFNRVDDSTFTLEFLFPLNKKIEYKLTKGSWSTEEINADGTAPSNHILVVKKDTALIHYVNIWGNAVPPEPVGQITGDVEYLRGIKTRDELLPRDIVVWLPPGYNQNTSERYPVLYMHDGQNIIDPATSALGID